MPADEKELPVCLCVCVHLTQPAITASGFCTIGVSLSVFGL